MARLTQKDRLFRVDTPLGTDVLLLQRFAGEEGVSTPFHYTLDLLSEEEAIDPADLLRKPMTVTIELMDGTRQIHGLVRRFVQLGQADELTMYQAEIVPWFWFLGLSHDCKIFQGKSVLEIVQEVFDGLKYSDYDIRCSQSYDPRPYCVQYRETHLNFVSRLFEEEGIFYFFEHSDDKHLLVVADANDAAKPCPGQEKARMAVEARSDEDLVTELRVESHVHIGAITLRDYDFTRPSLSLQSSATGEGVEEVYDYPGRYADLSAGERYARILLQEGQHRGQLVHGESTCRAFRSGYRFGLDEHYRPDANQDYVLLHVRQRAEAGDFRSWATAPLDYQNDFVCIPAKTPYRPPHRSTKPRIHGSQTAVVVGPSGEEIYTDEYGRVKVHFHWDRLDGEDENSSCWVRVSYPWAGKGWGGIQIPRMGQEVIVEFLEGDPDFPIITGRVYNAEQPVPYTLPDNRTQSGVKSRSSKEGGEDHFNEIRMEDKKGEELFYVHAEKDKEEMVEHDRSETVGNDETIDIGNDQSITIGNNETISVGKDRTEDVGGNEKITIEKDRSESVGGNESISVGGNRTESVAKSETVTIDADRGLEVGKNLAETIGANQTVEVGKDLKVTVGGKHTESVKKELSVNAKQVQLVAGDEVSLKAGKAEIVLKKNGDITINGKKITIKGSGDVVMKGSKIAQN
jgi:type VI secretion system secreted protein VgrG